MKSIQIYLLKNSPEKLVLVKLGGMRLDFEGEADNKS